MTWRDKVMERTERTVGVADPTVVVTVRVYGTDPDGTITRSTYCEVTECFGELTGKFVYLGKETGEPLTAHVCKMFYDMVEGAHARAMEQNEYPESWARL